MLLRCPFFALLAMAASATSIGQTANPTPSQPSLRCGWFSNPSPANVWLSDREAEWVISIQGGHEADGDWPRFTEKQWVSTNRSYGYGCACLVVITDAESKHVQRILSSEAKPLKTCREDRALKKPAI